MVVVDNNKTKSDSPVLINVSKGEEINISKEYPLIEKIIVGLGNDCNKGYDDIKTSIDATVFSDGVDGKTDEELFEFYNSFISYNDIDWHQQVIINLSHVPEDTHKIKINSVIDNNDNKPKFIVVDNAYCRLLDAEDNDKLIIHFDIGEEISIDDIIIVVNLYRNNGDWKLRAVGQRFEGGLEAYIKNPEFDEK